jgi:hypothetical protein
MARIRIKPAKLEELAKELDNVNTIGAHNVLHAGHLMGLSLVVGVGRIGLDGKTWVTKFDAGFGDYVWIGFEDIKPLGRYIIEVD